jgi:hypothetical protein
MHYLLISSRHHSRHCHSTAAAKTSSQPTVKQPPAQKPLLTNITCSAAAPAAALHFVHTTSAAASHSIHKASLSTALSVAKQTAASSRAWLAHRKQPAAPLPPTVAPMLPHCTGPCCDRTYWCLKPPHISYQHHLQHGFLHAAAPAAATARKCQWSRKMGRGPESDGPSRPLASSLPPALLCRGWRGHWLWLRLRFWLRFYLWYHHHRGGCCCCCLFALAQLDTQGNVVPDHGQVPPHLSTVKTILRTTTEGGSVRRTLKLARIIQFDVNLQVKHCKERCGALSSHSLQDFSSKAALLLTSNGANHSQPFAGLAAKAPPVTSTV